MPKYNYHEIHRSGDEVPAEVNEKAMKIAERFKDNALVDMLDKARRRRRFGKAYHTNPKTGRLAAVFEFHHGVVKDMKIVDWENDYNFFEGSILNDNVSFSKRGLQK